MSVTVEEMNVTTNVENTEGGGGQGGGEGGGEEQDMELVIRECIKRVLQELERRNKR